MSLSIIKYPQRFVDNNPNLLSRWNAVHHSMIYGMSRQDYPVQFFYNPSTQVLIAVITLGTMIDSPLPGDKVYCEGANGSGTFTIDTFSFPNIFTFLPQVWTGGTGVVGFINLLSRQNYFSLTNVYGVDLNNQYVLIGQSRNKPDSTGRLNVDVSSFLKNDVDYVDEFEYNILNQKDLTLGGGYNITYSENWQLFEGTFSGLSNSDLSYYVNSAKQIMDLYGSNMGEYVPFYFIADVGFIPLAKWLSDFESPTYFPGFPFSLSFVYSEYLAGIETFRNEENFDVNGQTISTNPQALLDNAEVQNVNRLLITEPIASNIKCVDVWLSTEGTINCIKYQTGGYVQIGYVLEVCGLPIVSLPPDSGGLSTS